MVPRLGRQVREVDELRPAVRTRLGDHTRTSVSGGKGRLEPVPWLGKLGRSLANSSRDRATASGRGTPIASRSRDRTSPRTAPGGSRSSLPRSTPTRRRGRRGPGRPRLPRPGSTRSRGCGPAVEVERRQELLEETCCRPRTARRRRRTPARGGPRPSAPFVLAAGIERVVRERVGDRPRSLGASSIVAVSESSTLDPPTVRTARRGKRLTQRSSGGGSVSRCENHFTRTPNDSETSATSSVLTPPRLPPPAASPARTVDSTSHIRSRE